MNWNNRVWKTGFKYRWISSLRLPDDKNGFPRWLQMSGWNWTFKGALNAHVAAQQSLAGIMEVKFEQKAVYLPRGVEFVHDGPFAGDEQAAHKNCCCGWIDAPSCRSCACCNKDGDL